MSSAVPSPRVSIAVPVYNGERYVARTLDSLLGQTFGDFELIITDNASTDATRDICADYARRDRRIQYHRAEQNKGVAANFRWGYELARAPFFKWNAADDLCAPTFLEECVRVLEQDPEVVLAFPRTMIIDEDDRPLHPNTYDADADHPSPACRFSRLMNINHRMHGAHELYGLIRRSALQRIPVYDRVVRSDSIMLARLALLGRFRCVEKPLFLNREHARRSVAAQTPGRKLLTRSRLSRWIGQGPVPPAHFWNPALKGRIVFPEWRVWREYAVSMRFADLEFADRLACYAVFTGYTVRHIPKLVRDLVIAAEHVILGEPGARQPPATPSPQVEPSSV